MAKSNNGDNIKGGKTTRGWHNIADKQINNDKVWWIVHAILARVLFRSCFNWALKDGATRTHTHSQKVIRGCSMFHPRIGTLARKVPCLRTRHAKLRLWMRSKRCQVEAIAFSISSDSLKRTKNTRKAWGWRQVVAKASPLSPSGRYWWDTPLPTPGKPEPLADWPHSSGRRARQCCFSPQFSHSNCSFKQDC